MVFENHWLRAALHRARVISANRLREAQHRVDERFAQVHRSLRNSRVRDALPLRWRQDLPEQAWPVGLQVNDWASDRPFQLFRDIQDLPAAASLVRGFKTPIPPHGALLVLVSASQQDADIMFNVRDVPALVEALPNESLILVATSEVAVHELETHQLDPRSSVVLDPGTIRKRAALLSIARAVIVSQSSPESDFAEDSWATTATATATPLIPFLNFGLDHPPDETAYSIRALLANHTTLKARGREARLAAIRKFDQSTGAPTLDELERQLMKNDSLTHIQVRQKPRLLIASHDLKFASGLLKELDRRMIPVDIDKWQGHARHDEKRSQQLLANANAVFCEWTLGNAEWFTHRAPSNVRVTSRFHMQERSVHFIDDLNWARLNALIFVAEHARQEVARDHRVELKKLWTIPNTVEIPDSPLALDPDRRFNLALVGIVPLNKCLHTALDVIEILRAYDPRYKLHIRGRLPSSYEWMNKRTEAQTYYQTQLRRVQTAELLRDGVELVPFGDGLFEWYQTQGIVLSTSEFEAFHYSLPEGAVHGAVPFSIAWPGADQTYPVDWLAADAQQLAQLILDSTQDESIWRQKAESSASYIASRFAESRVSSMLADVILGTVE